MKEQGSKITCSSPCLMPPIPKILIKTLSMNVSFSLLFFLFRIASYFVPNNKINVFNLFRLVGNRKNANLMGIKKLFCLFMDSFMQGLLFWMLFVLLQLGLNMENNHLRKSLSVLFSSKSKFFFAENLNYFIFVLLSCCVFVSIFEIV